MTVKAGIFDQDGVITDTAEIHFKAWKRMFDELLDHAFTERDYLYYVDGKPRLDGIASFFKSMQIDMPLGSVNDTVSDKTLHGLAKRKQRIFLDIVDQGGVPLLQSTITFIHQLHQNNIKTAVVSSSKNCELMLKLTDTHQLFETRVDGETLAELNLAGKPKPDMFLEAARRIGVNPSDIFIVEDALSGVQAGRAGEFGLVIGIDRKGTMKEAFYANGADIVVSDMSQITFPQVVEMMREKKNA